MNKRISYSQFLWLIRVFQAHLLDYAIREVYELDETWYQAYIDGYKDEPHNALDDAFELLEYFQQQNKKD